MVHQYKNNGYNMVLDVASGSVHVVDDLTYEVIALYEDHTLEEIIKELSSWDEKDVKESYGEVTELKDAGVLFTEDCYEEYICGFKDRPTVVKALCLHIAHDCNLACRYCFAEEGEYKGRRALMSAEVGKKALDFLVENSGNRRNLEVDFFGGEPLMNFDVVKEIVAYGRSLEETHDKKFRFTLTTNGVLLNDDIMEFANKEMDNVVLSVDGRKEVHDYMRPFRNGKGSYDFIIDKFKKFADSRNQKKYYVRGTFTHHNLDFSKDVMHLADAGFEQISVEPVVAQDTADYAITEAGFGEDLGAEKFLDIKCRMAGIKPDAVVIVATVRALKYNGGVAKPDLNEENLEALENGIPNLMKHVDNIKNVYGLPCVVAINAFPTDTKAELDLVEEKCKEVGVNVALSEVWAKGGEGGLKLAEEVVRLCEEPGDFHYAYELEGTIEDKLDQIVQKIYGGNKAVLTAAAQKQVKQLTDLGFGNAPICMAKTQYSLTDDPKKLGAPEDFEITVRNLKISAGAGFIVALTGDIMTMPGLPKVPAAERIDVDDEGRITGLF